MNKTINFGIDLGTTNSAIAKYENGEIILFKNPLNLKQTLPSVVAFRKNRTIIGDKAREIIQKDPANVIGGFKRKMGTSDTWKIPNLDDQLNAEQLSALILKELKNFIHTGEIPESVVITIPASFDTMQSNATKKAGYAAGFKEVVLLQEPIAASLAYANRANQENADMKWLVYDLGGGTFDVALLSIEEEEMKVIDHEGNNYLGGTDFDKAIIEKLILPKMQEQGSFANLENEMKSATGKYNKLYNLLQYKAEEAKIELTNAQVAEVEFETEDDTGEEIEFFFEISREEFNQAIQPQVEITLDLIQQVVNRNMLNNNEIAFVLMIGGSTYIPYVKEQVAARFDLEINCSIDPTAAVATGAAYFAGMKPTFIEKEEKPSEEKTATKPAIIIETAFSKATQDKSTPLLVRAKGDLTEKTYRITRDDAGFDSGTKELVAEFMEYLPLVEGLHNQFTFKIFDKFNNPVAAQIPTIGIMQGKFTIDGQPLPHDICLEVDVAEEETTVLEPIFKRNSVLPLKKTIVKEISKNIRAHTDDSLLINIVEGPVMSLAAANKTIGFVKIAGHELERDLIKGSEVELVFEMSESRDLKVEVFLVMNDQEFANVFSPSITHLDTQILNDDLRALTRNLQSRLRKAESKEEYTEASKIAELIKETESLTARLDRLQVDDVTDEKYQIDEAKRGIARKMFAFFNSSVLQRAIEKYYELRNGAKQFFMFSDLATDQDRNQFDTMLKDEKSVLQSDNLSAIKMKTKQIEGLISRVNSRRTITNDDIIGYFSRMRAEKYQDQVSANGLIQKGETALAANNFGLVLDISNQLYRQLDQERNDTGGSFKSRGTGLK